MHMSLVGVASRFSRIRVISKARSRTFICTLFVLPDDLQ
jgi:hypothetical protein